MTAPTLEPAQVAHAVATRREDYNRQLANAAKAAQYNLERPLLRRYNTTLRDARREYLASLAAATTPTARTAARLLHTACARRAALLLQADLQHIATREVTA